jgi:hypothetical protein
MTKKESRLSDLHLKKAVAMLSIETAFLFGTLNCSLPGDQPLANL